MLQKEGEEEWGIPVRRRKGNKLFSYVDHRPRQYVEGLLRCFHSDSCHLLLYLHHSAKLLRLRAALVRFHRLLGRRVVLLPRLHVFLVSRIQRCRRAKDYFWIQENCETVLAHLVRHWLHFHLPFSNIYDVGRPANKAVSFAAYAALGQDSGH